MVGHGLDGAAEPGRLSAERARGEGAALRLDLLLERLERLGALDRLARLLLGLRVRGDSCRPNLGYPKDDPAACASPGAAHEPLLCGRHLGEQLGVAADTGDNLFLREERGHVGGHHIIGEGVPLLVGGELGRVDLLP